MKYALVANKISTLLPLYALRSDDTHEININIAIKHHEEYTQCLKGMNLEIIYVDTDNNLPDSVFVEDTVIIIDKVALLTNVGHVNRFSEKYAMHQTLLNLVNLNKIECMNLKRNEFLDGGDVLFTGKEIFIGSSKRTTIEGIDCVKKIFPQYKVHTINMNNECSSLHLKSVCSCAIINDIKTIMYFGSSTFAQYIKKQIAKLSLIDYIYETVPGIDTMANIIYANNVLMCRKDSNDDTKTWFINHGKEHNIDVKFIDNSELAKVDGALTCCSVIY